MNQQIKVAVYMRVSREDETMDGRYGTDSVSNSIRMQKILLEGYAAEHFESYQLLEFKDDGYSGLNFDRPGVKQMLKLAEKSAIDCILVKDFSRFSRDYIELGAYIDTIFPLLSIRFISVNDHYDSLNPEGADGLAVSFRNLLYDLYSRDLSIKVKTSLAAKKDAGQYAGANCPFGYGKAEGDKHKLVILEEEAAIVNRIFSMAIEGNTSARIAKIFNQEGVKTPLAFQIEKGKTNRVPKGNRFFWSASAICQILRNEMYTGDFVYGKYEKTEAGGNSRKKPETEWKVIRNHHMPVISREVFELAQAGRRRAKTETRCKRHSLTGKLICASCGRNLFIRRMTEPYFACPNRYMSEDTGCIRKINASFLESAILSQIPERIYQMEDADKMEQERARLIKRTIREWKENRKRLLIDIKGLEREEIINYEKYAKNEKEFSIFQEEKKRIAERKKQAAERREEAEREIGRLTKELSAEPDRGEVLAFFGWSELTEKTVNTLIQKIIVHDEKRFNIVWKQDSALF